jgi:hypothetical protein
MILPCEVIKLSVEGTYEDKIYQPLIIEDGVEYDLIKTPDLILEVWCGDNSYIYGEEEYVFFNKSLGEYLVVPFDKVKYQ